MFRDDRYSRNLIYRDPIFEVMAIGWKPGQKTPVHTHNGQLGWMLVEQGALSVKTYRYAGCNAPDNQNVSGLDCLGGATTIQLDLIDSETAEERGAVSTVDRSTAQPEARTRIAIKAPCFMRSPIRPG